MMSSLLRAFLFPACLFSCFLAFAQHQPIGRWRAHLPYNNAQGVATDGITLYTISDKGFFTYNSATGDHERFSKVEGLHETGTSAIGYDRATSTCIIAYKNSNIDLYRNHNFKVLPGLKNINFSGSKSVNHIYTDAGFAYLSTNLGIVVIDLDKQEEKETYIFSRGGQIIGINAFSADTKYFYAATARGLYRILRTSPTPQVFTAWQVVDTQRIYTRLAVARDSVVYAATLDTVFLISPSGSQAVYAGLHTLADSIAVINHINAGKNVLYIGQVRPKTGAAKLYHLSLNSNTISDSTRIAYPRGAVETADEKTWVADLYQGLGKRDTSGGINLIIPPGPNSPDNTGLWAGNGELWIAHGGVSSSYNRLGSRAGMSHFQYEAWQVYQPYNYSLFYDSVYDFLDIMKDPRDGTLYAGTYNSGLVELKADGTGRIIKQGELLPGANLSEYPATSSAIDAQGNLFVTQSFNNSELAVRTAGGSWYHYPTPFRTYRLAYGLLIDDYEQKWFYSPLGGGVVVYNDGGTPDNIADDASVVLSSGKGQGNLPSKEVHCLAKDRDGAIWIGTDDGIGIINCPSGAIDRSCEAELRPVQYDQFAGLLFKGESVRAIAVDGANRKWIGTTNGVWLLSPDAGKIVSRFTADNSPLPSNTIQKIAIDGTTGDVYIGTDEGLVSYRGTATDGGTVNSTVRTFPNPVPSGYSGSIAIQGLVTDADVRITDIAGQLIYRTKATGGQAVWNGLDYTGTRPQSGVYLIFITNKDGSQTTVGKMMFMN